MSGKTPEEVDWSRCWAPLWLILMVERGPSVIFSFIFIGTYQVDFVSQARQKKVSVRRSRNFFGRAALIRAHSMSLPNRIGNISGTS